MKRKTFYSHIIDTETLIIELDKMDLTEEEKAHLIALIDSNLHHMVLDAILSELSHEDKKIFLRLLELDDHAAIWRHLNRKVDTIETRIKKAAGDLRKELHEDIEEAKRKHD